MIELQEIDKLLLEEIQQDLPLVGRPFMEIGRRIGLDEASVLSHLISLKEKTYIRDISAIFIAKGLGYKSTLVALSSPEPDKIAKCISQHPGVSHNYYRKHDFNVWFTLTIPEKEDINSEIQVMLKGQNYRNYRILPSIRTFKIGVNFRFTDKKKRSVKVQESTLKKGIVVDKNLVKILQNPFPLIPEPWNEMAQNSGKTVEQLLEHIDIMKKEGIIKRISGVLRHRNAGFKANGMACFRIDESKVVDSGIKASGFEAVSHCYQRPVYPDWPYSLFAMTHGRTEKECEGIIDEITKEIGADECLILYSTKEYKKERVKYFIE